MPDSTDIRIHERYMRRCFQLARKGRPLAKTNPLVGCCIVYQNRIIGEGFHHVFGEQHAEIDALNNVAEADRGFLKDATLYVSLAPCNHQGKTPACADRILELGIPIVVVGLDEINPVAAGSVARMRNAGISVITGILEAEATELIRSFSAGVVHHRPYITLKWAQSADGFIGHRGEEVIISSTLSKLKVHDLRRQHNAILIGNETAIVDNPRLTTRVIPGQNPLRVVLSGKREIPQSHHLMSDDHETVVFTDQRYSYIPADSTKQIVVLKKTDLRTILPILYAEYHVGWLMVEGGARTLTQFINQNLWDECWRISSSNSLTDGIEAPILNATTARSFELGDNRFEIMHSNLK